MSQFSQPAGGPLQAGQFAVAELRAIRSPWQPAFFGLLCAFLAVGGMLTMLAGVARQDLFAARRELAAERIKAATHEESATRWHKLYDDLLPRIGPAPHRPTGSAGAAGSVGSAGASPSR